MNCHHGWVMWRQEICNVVLFLLGFKSRDMLGCCIVCVPHIFELICLYCCTLKNWSAMFSLPVFLLYKYVFLHKVDRLWFRGHGWQTVLVKCSTFSASWADFTLSCNSLVAARTIQAQYVMCSISTWAYTQKSPPTLLQSVICLNTQSTAKQCCKFIV